MHRGTEMVNFDKSFMFFSVASSTDVEALAWKLLTLTPRGGTSGKKPLRVHVTEWLEKMNLITLVTLCACTGYGCVLRGRFEIRSSNKHFAISNES